MSRRKSVLCLLIVTLCLHSANFRSGRSGIELTDDAGSSVRIKNIEIGGDNYKELVLPGEYSPAGWYPSTQIYERVFTFAVPEDAVPHLTFSTSGIRKFTASELIPAKTFSKDPAGIISEVYTIPGERIETDAEHAELIRLGNSGTMELYRLIVRPLSVYGETANLAEKIYVKISFSKPFRNEAIKTDGADFKTDKDILNYEYAVSNPVVRKRKSEPVFLDRQTKWVRLQIKDEGIYKITGASLASLGIDLSPVLCDRIKVYSSAGKDLDQSPVSLPYHGAQEITRIITDVNNDGFFNSTDQIVFYAAGPVARDLQSYTYYFNKYSDFTYYWIDTGIGSSENGKKMEELSVPGGFVQERNVFKKHIFSESRTSYYSSAESFLWYNRAIDPYSSHSVSFQMTGIYAPDSVLVTIRHSNEVTNTSRMNYVINNNPLTETVSLLTTFQKKFGSEYFIPNSLNTVKMSNTGLQYTKYYNGFEIIYSDSVKAGLSDEYFYSEASAGLNCRLKIGNSAGKKLFDITDPLNVKMSVLNDNNCIVNPADRNAYLLFAGIFRTPVSVSLYDNTFSRSAHSRNTNADMVIITPREFNRYFRTGTGLEYIMTHISYDNDVRSVAVVSMDTLSNEFGRGYQEPAATRNFIRYAHENWGTEYFLLAGDGTYFIRNGQSQNDRNHIYPSDPNFSGNLGSGSDDFYANLSSTSPFQNISIGRFPAANTTDLDNIVRKTLAFMKNSGVDNQRAKVLLVADDERSLNSGGTWEERMHIRNTESLISPSIPKYYYTDKLYMTEYPFEYSAATGLYLKPRAEQDLIRKLNGGVNFLCYVGHGAPMQLAHEKIFTPASFRSVNNFDRYFFMFGATCSFGVFIDPQTVYLAEQMLINPVSGSVGLINSVTAVYTTSNEYLVKAFLDSAFTDDDRKLTIGKALKLAKNAEPRSGNSSKFMLLGDPALNLFSDTKAVVSDTSVELFTLRPDSISSRLMKDSVVMYDRSGVLNTLIVDSEVKRAYFNSEQWDSPTDTLRYVLPGKIILSAKSAINEGRAVTRFILPKDLNYGENKGKIIFYGRDKEGKEYTGSIDSVSIKGDSGIFTTDSIPPVINLFYNSLNYLTGDPIGENPFIFIRIEDDNGINTSGGIGHKIIMEIDGTAIDVTPYFSYDIDSYQKGVASYQLVGLAPGTHNIKVSAWDNFNNYNEKSESFTVLGSDSKNDKWIGNLLNYPNPVKRKGTTFGFTVNMQSELSSYSITLYTINGRKVKTVENSNVDYSDQFQSVYWDGKDADGDIPANGVYIYVLRAKFSDGKTISKKGKLIFAR